VNQALATISLCNERPAATRAARGGWLATSVLVWIVCGGACAAPSWQGTWKENLAALVDEESTEEAPTSVNGPVQSSPSDVQPALFDEPTEMVIEPIELVEAEFPQSMSLEDIIWFTLERHPLLAARRHEIDVARGALITAGAFPNPQLVMDADGPVDGDGATDLSARLEFTIPTAGKRRFAQAAAQADVRRAQLALREESDRIAAAAADAALEVLYLQELAGLQARVEQLARQAAEIQKGRLEQGVITEIDSLGAEVDAVDVEADRLATVTQLESARLRLAREMGLATPRPLEVTGSLTVEYLPQVPLETVLHVARQVRPELARAGVDVVRRRHELALSKANSVPDFQIGPRYGESFDDPNDTAGMRFSTDLPVFDVNQGGVCTSAAELRRTGALFDVAEITTLNDVASSYVQLAPIESRLNYFDEYVLPLTERAEEAIRQAQASNVIDPLQLSQQLRTLSRLRLSHLELRYLHTRIRTRLELLLGRPLNELHVEMRHEEPEIIAAPSAELPLFEAEASAKPPAFRR
jgi:cobalt-zinc-cadmium efflux system outer membrane protein